MRSTSEQKYPIISKMSSVFIPVARRIDRIYIQEAYSWWGCAAEEVGKWHTNPPNNWSDIGYHNLVNFGSSPGNIRDDAWFPRGLIQQGRSVDISGAHVRGDNSHSILRFPRPYGGLPDHG